MKRSCVTSLVHRHISDPRKLSEVTESNFYHYRWRREGAHGHVTSKKRIWHQKCRFLVWHLSRPCVVWKYERKQHNRAK